MIDIASITSNTIELRGVSFSDGEKVQKIMNICHREKHMFLEGYPCGRKTRAKNQLRLKKWRDCPEICFTYLVTDDNVSHNLAIHILVSDLEHLIERYKPEVVEHFLSMYTQKVADDIISELGNE